jgi:tRNA/rRNA methyltransferase
MISIVIIEPETSGNIGSIARVMANFDEHELILVNPKCKIDSDCRRFAKNAQGLIDKIRIEDKAVLKSFDYLVGTTSKLGTDYNIPRTPMTPEQFAGMMAGIKGKKVALILGREGQGLHNDEIEMCDFIVTIPTSKSYGSMNISHSLAILLYALHREDLTQKLLKPYTPIGEKDKEQIIRILKEAMDKMGFTKESKKETQVKVWKRMVSKSFMTRREAFALMGFLKKIK